MAMHSADNPIAIVGAGPGGLAAAVVLAEAGHAVVVIERGDEFVAGNAKTAQFNYDSSPLPWPTGSDEWSGPIELNRSLGIGGSTLYFQAVSYMPADNVLTQWGLPLGEIKKAEREVIGFLNLAGVHQPLHPVNACSNQLLLGAKKLGWEANPATVAILSRPHNNRPACNHCGLCVFGCMPRDKSSANNTWYPRLLAHSRVRIIKNTQVKKIILSDGYTAKALQLDDGKQVYELPVKAVVLAAGVLETPYLLKNSSQTFAPNGLGNSFVGKYLSGSLLYSMMIDVAGATKGYAGVPVDIVVDQFLAQGIMLCQGRNLGGIAGPASLAKFYTRHYGPVGMREWVQKHYDSLAVIAGFAEFEGGELDGIYHSSQKRFSLAPTKESASRIKQIADLLQQWRTAAGAKILFAPTQDKALPTGAMLRGTCKLGKTAEAGAVMPDGRLYGYNNVIIADASVLSNGLIAHPSLPIQVLGYYFGQQLIKRLAA